MMQLRDQKSDVRGQMTDSGQPLAGGEGIVGPALRLFGQKVHQNPEVSRQLAQSSVVDNRSSAIGHPALSVALLTGGGDKPYALGMAAALTSVGIQVDFIGSDDLSVPELLSNDRVNFRNLRGDQRHDANWAEKIVRVFRYYVSLTVYAVTAKPKLFHILWNNKFQLLDCTLLMLYYRLLGKKVVFTAHNVNAGKRDSNDSWLNRALLRIQYNLCDHIFVHTDGMKRELASEFRIPESKVSVIPFGINIKFKCCGDNCLINYGAY